MATIADLSDAPQYTIKAVSRQTGIRPVTLRAWERRYRPVEPQRTAGNYRLYSERDVAVLRWLKRRVDSGVAVSGAAAELEEMRRTGRWPEAVAPLEKPPTTAPVATPPALFARRLYQALTAHDEAAAGDLLGEAHALFDLTTICREILTPCLVEIGEAWLRGDIRISTEHFASTYLRGRLLGMLQSFPARRDAPKILVGCAAGERHEIGSLMLALLLRREGYLVEFLGADVPTEDLLDYAREARPAMVCLSAGAEEPARELARVQRGLEKMRPRPRFGFGGRLLNLKSARRQAIPGIFLGETAAEACRAVQQLLPLSR